jgi:hypothetical protein
MRAARASLALEGPREFQVWFAWKPGRDPYPISGPPLNLALAPFDPEPFTRRRIKHLRGSVKRQRKMRKKATVSKKATVKGRVASPAEYRQFAVESVQRCIAAPNKNKRRKAVHLMMAQAWAKLADQAEEWRMHHPRQQRHRAA